MTLQLSRVFISSVVILFLHRVTLSQYTIAANVLSFVQIGPKLVGTGSVDNPQQGSGCALSGDGNTAVLGGPFDNGGIGAAWVYIRDPTSGTWSQQGPKLVGSNSSGRTSSQGESVDLSADGNTLIMGGFSDSDYIGAAWVFGRDAGGTWTQQGDKLVGTNALGPSPQQQGSSVAISSDGNTFISGAIRDDVSVGAAWIFVRNASNLWTEQAKLVGSGGVSNVLQGTSVDLSGDGNTAVVGGYLDDFSTGAVWVFVRNGIEWSQQGDKLVRTGSETTTLMGQSVAISADGNTMIAGGPLGNNLVGAAWVFVRSGDTWTQVGTKLTAPAQRFGSSVCLSADGTIASIGSRGSDSQVGGTWVFAFLNGTWTVQGSQLQGSNAIIARQGSSTSLSHDGLLLLIGGPSDNGTVGAGWVFARVSEAPSISPTTSSAPSSSPVVTTLPSQAPTASSAPSQSPIMSAAPSLSPFGSAAQTQSPAVNIDPVPLDTPVPSAQTQSPAVSIAPVPLDTPVPSAQTQSPAVNIDPVPVDPPVPSACKPSFRTKKRACQTRMSLCSSNRIALKWNQGCNRGDGGCQCRGYCGYKCKRACERDIECFWRGTKCFSKATSLPGGEIPFCPPLT